MTISAKLLTLDGIKTDIKAAIEAKGVDTTDALFSEYAGKILDIIQGDTSEYIRPSDWLALPEVLETDDTMVALFAVHEADKNIVAFQIRGAFTVDWGDGNIENFADNAVAYHNYNYADLSIDTLSSRGYKQAIMVITPQSGQVISSFKIVAYPITPRPLYPCYNFLDIVLSFPNATSFGLGYTSTSVGRAYLKMIESFEMKSSFLSVSSFVYLFSCQTNLKQAIIKSNSAVTDMSYMFNSCYSLTSVPLFDTSAVKNMTYMFNSCYSLTSVPLFDTSAVEDMSYMFISCYSLTSVPLFDTSAVKNMTYMFYNCFSLSTVPLFDTSAVISMYAMFSYCYALTSVPSFDTSEVTNMNNMFNYCHSLKRIQFPILFTADLGYLSLEVAALVEIFNNLPTKTGQTLYIANNPGAALLSVAERKIATNKGWTLSG